MTPAVSVILPVHNQADHVGAVIADYRAALVRLAVPWEIILVENGSRDASAATCEALAARHPDLRALGAEPAGWGSAVRTGLTAARGEILCFTNSARTRGEDLRRAVEAGLAAPERVLKAERRQRQAWTRRLGSWLYNLEARMLFGLRLRDVNGTPKLFHRRFAALLDLRQDGDLIDLEFCVLCQRHGYPLASLPIDAAPRHGGRSTTRWRSAIRLYRGALRLRTELAR